MKTDRSSYFDVPDIMSDGIGRVSSTLHHVTNVIKDSRSVESLTVDSESAKVIAKAVNGKLLVVIAEKNVNLPLFKLMSNMAVSKIKSAAECAPPPAQGAPGAAPGVAAGTADAQQICELYGQMFKAAAGKLMMILGPKAGSMFDEKLAGSREKHQTLMEGVSIQSSGVPDTSKLCDNAANLPKDQLVNGLEDILASMIDVVKKTAGQRVGERTELEITKIKEDNKGLI